MKSRVLFLDYDGVVNTPIWNDKGTKARFNFPKDGKVNNFQAVCWLNDFCKRYKFDIVVSSTWREYPNYEECLRNGGLHKDIKILGSTPILPSRMRGKEIDMYLSEHPEIKYYLIVDDDDDLLDYQKSHFVKTNMMVGFNYVTCIELGSIQMKDRSHGNSFWDKEIASHVEVH